MDKADRAAYTARLRDRLADAGLINDICGHVANGGTLITLAKEWDLKFSDLSNWIHTNKEYDQRYIKALNDRGEWAAERILHEFRQLAYSDIREAFNADGSLKSIDEIPESVARAIQSIDIDELYEGVGAERQQVGLTKKVKFWNKSDALLQLGKQLGMFNPVNKHLIGKTLEELVAASNEPTPAAPLSPSTLPATSDPERSDKPLAI